MADSRMTIDFNGCFTIAGEADRLDSIMETVRDALDSCSNDDGIVDLTLFSWECIDSR